MPGGGGLAHRRRPDYSARMPRESKKALRERATAIGEELKRLYPDAKCSLDFENPYQLWVATVLSASCSSPPWSSSSRRLRIAAPFALFLAGPATLSPKFA